MKLKLFTLAYDGDRKTFDDGEMVAFLADKEALSASEHFFVQEETRVLAVFATDEPALQAATRFSARKYRPRDLCRKQLRTTVNCIVGRARWSYWAPLAPGGREQPDRRNERVRYALSL